MKVLMVCLGNICRSPLAEGILRQKIIENNLPWTVDSAGTASWHTGNAPDPRSIHVASNHGIDISGLSARQFDLEDLIHFDKILAMDAENYQNILALANGINVDKVEMILNYSYLGQNRQVPDPYYGKGDGFEEVYQMLNKACDALVQQLYFQAK